MLNENGLNFYLLFQWQVLRTSVINILQAGCETAIEKLQNGAVETFEEYWSKFGEQLVWNSWVEKYGEYIDLTPYAPPVVSEEIVSEEIVGEETVSEETFDEEGVGEETVSKEMVSEEGALATEEHNESK